MTTSAFEAGRAERSVTVPDRPLTRSLSVISKRRRSPGVEIEWRGVTSTPSSSTDLTNHRGGRPTIRRCIDPAPLCIEKVPSAATFAEPALCKPGRTGALLGRDLQLAMRQRAGACRHPTTRPSMRHGWPCEQHQVGDVIMDRNVTYGAVPAAAFGDVADHEHVVVFRHLSKRKRPSGVDCALRSSIAPPGYWASAEHGRDQRRPFGSTSRPLTALVFAVISAKSTPVSS